MAEAHDARTQVRRLLLSGVLGSHGKIPGKLDFPHNLAVDSTGAIYVAEIKNWRVQKFVPR